MHLCGCLCPMEFLSTPSARRATADFLLNTRVLRISIHALREEGDCGLARSRQSKKHFYPRPPRGGRRTTLAIFLRKPYFYPRPPRGGRLEGDKSKPEE